MSQGHLSSEPASQHASHHLEQGIDPHPGYPLLHVRGHLWSQVVGYGFTLLENTQDPIVSQRAGLQGV